MPDLRDVLALLRDYERDPELHTIFYAVAIEIVTSSGGASDQRVLDPDYLELCEDDRAAFLHDFATDLARALQRAALTHALLDAETVADWRHRNGRA